MKNCEGDQKFPHLTRIYLKIDLPLLSLSYPRQPRLIRRGGEAVIQNCSNTLDIVGDMSYY